MANLPAEMIEGEGRGTRALVRALTFFRVGVDFGFDMVEQRGQHGPRVRYVFRLTFELQNILQWGDDSDLEVDFEFVGKIAFQVRRERIRTRKEWYQCGIFDWEGAHGWLVDCYAC